MATTLDDHRDPSPADAVDAALSDAVDRHRVRRPTSERRHREAADVLPGGNTRSVLHVPPFPVYMERGEGCRVWDVDGHRYLDALGEFTAGLFGHSHPLIRAAIDRALDDGINLAGPSAGEAELGRAIRRRFSSIDLLRFTNSGTEANLMALAAATVHTGRRSIVVFRGGYHGGVLTFGDGSSPVNVPHRFVIAPFNDLASTRAVVGGHADDVAAILVEPMQGSAGCIPGTRAFLAGLRALADELGALLIFDEVMTSRLSGGGSQGRVGVRPDLTTLGKYMGGGMSCGAFGGRRDVMVRFDPRLPGALPHAGTFNNNVLTMAAGVTALNLVYTPEAARALDERGEALRDRLDAVFVRSGTDLQCTGVGSLMNLHPTARPIRSVDDLQHADPRLRDLLYFELLDRGIYTARRGFIALSLPFGEPEVDDLVAAVDDVVTVHRDLFRVRP